MKHKKLSFKVVDEDVRAVALSVVGLTLGRLSSEYTAATGRLTESFKNDSSIEILENIQQIIDSLEKGIKELNDKADLIEQIPDLKLEEEPKKK
tara:strand:+ start:1161 stop:1442 length:282 start_codon:yes stop_codon:yes gene_type:complete